MRYQHASKTMGGFDDNIKCDVTISLIPVQGLNVKEKNFLPC